uniref:Uncharacterized protein n=1 Tax=Caenorhabditis japonica TaxID=281687 RepID=A0A8R1I865_CAEJA
MGAGTSPKTPSSMCCVQQHQEHHRCPVLPANPNSTLRSHRFTGSHVWTFSKIFFSERVRVAHAALERRLVGIPLSEQRQRNLHREDIRAQSDVRDLLLVINKKKLGWAGHIMRRNYDRWTRLVQEWYPIG